MSEERIVITVQENGSRVVSANLRSIGEGANASEAAVRSLKTALSGLAGVLAINQIKEFADAYVRSASLVNIFTKSQAETNVVMGKLFGIAQNARQGLEQTVKTYHQMAIAGSVLNASQNDMLRVTDLAAKAFAIQGTSTQLAKAGIIQLSHSFTEGLVRGRQFNALLIDAPRLLQVAANNIDAAGGSIGKLRQMMLAGQLTSRMFFDALNKGAADLDPLFNRTQKTFSQAFTVLKNAMIQYIGQLNQASSVSNLFFGVMKFAADNIDVLAKSLLAVSSPLILFGLLAVGRALQGIALAALANPYLALASIVLTAVTALALFKDQINLGIDSTTTLGDLWTAVWADIKIMSSDVFQFLDTTWHSWVDAFTAGTSDMLKGTLSSTAGMSTTYSDFFKTQDSGFAGFLEVAAKTIDAIAGLLTGLGIYLYRSFVAIGAMIEDIFKNALASIKTYAANIQNELIDIANRASSLVGGKQMSLVKVPGSNTDHKNFEDAGKSLSESFKDGFDIQGGFAQGLVANLLKQSKAAGLIRQKNAADEAKAKKDAAAGLNNSLGNGNPDDFGHSGKTPRGRGLDNPDVLAKAYLKLVNQVQPMAGVTLEYARAQDILNREVELGIQTNGKEGISLERKNELLALVKNHYRDIVDPIGKVTRDLDREAGYMKMNSDEREVAIKLYSIEQDLMNKGQILSAGKIASIRAEIVANQELNKIMQIQDGLRAGSSGQQLKTTGRNIKASNNLTSDPNSGFSKTDAFDAANKDLGGQLDATSGGLAAKLEAEKQFQKKLAMYRQAGTIDQQTADQAQLASYTRMQMLKLQTTSQFLGVIAQLQSSHNKKLAAIGKAAAVAQALVNTYTGATAAFQSAATIPVVGWIMAPIAAAAAVAAGLAQVQQIRSTSYSSGYKQGGYTGDIGVDQVAGNVHGREYVMDAATTARIGVGNLDAMRAGTAGPGAGGNVQAAAAAVPQSIRIINVPHDQAIGDYMASDAGEKIVINTLKRNSELVRSLA